MTSDSDKEGMLQRKNDLDEGGRKVWCVCQYTCFMFTYVKATMRTWKQYYTVLSGLELCFYKDRKDFQQVITNHNLLHITIFKLYFYPAENT